MPHGPSAMRQWTEEFHCPQPSCGVAVHCGISTTHCPSAVGQYTVPVPPCGGLHTHATARCPPPCTERSPSRVEVEPAPGTSPQGCSDRLPHAKGQKCGGGGPGAHGDGPPRAAAPSAGREARGAQGHSTTRTIGLYRERPSRCNRPGPRAYLLRRSRGFSSEPTRPPVPVGTTSRPLPFGNSASHRHTYTMRTANKNRARKAVKEKYSGAAGQPWTSFGLLIENDEVQSWTVGSVQVQISSCPLTCSTLWVALISRPRKTPVEEFVFRTAQNYVYPVLGATTQPHTHKQTGRQKATRSSEFVIAARPSTRPVCTPRVGRHWE